MPDGLLPDLLSLPAQERLDLAERLWQSVLDETTPEEQALRLALLVQALEARARGRAAGRTGAGMTPREFGQGRGLFTVPDDFDDPLPPGTLEGVRKELLDRRELEILSANAEELNREAEDVLGYQAENHGAKGPEQEC